MNVLVSDTSVLIDPERGEILQTSVALPFDFAVPDLLYRQELAEHGGPGLLELGLRIEDHVNQARISTTGFDASGLQALPGFAMWRAPCLLPMHIARLTLRQTRAVVGRHPWTVMTALARRNL